MPGPITIREPRPSDFDGLVSAFYSYFDEVQADPTLGLALFRVRPTMEEEKVWFSAAMKDIEDGNLVMLVAEVDSRIAGNCVVRRVRPGSAEDHRGNLGISLRKEFRGQGIGEALIRESLGKCKGKFETIELAVFTSNQRAKRLYERLGFRTYGTRKEALKRGGRYFDEDLMSLKL